MSPIETPGGSPTPFGRDLASSVRRLEYHSGDHIQRYSFASQAIVGRDILDLGSGHGFGALFLARNGRTYVGVDSDPSAIAWASQWVQPTLESAVFLTRDQFEKMDPLPRFDAVVLLEVLEHVDDPRALLQFCHHQLRPGGQLILSTPNGLLSDGNPELYMSPYHVKEFLVEEVRGLLREARFDGSFFVQYRPDHFDAATQLLKRAFLSRSRRTEPTLRPAHEELHKGGLTAPRSRLSAFHRVYAACPQWPALWRTSPLDRYRGPPWGFTHILVSGRAT